MITNGWVTWAIQAPGVPDKIYSERNRGIGLVGHSIVGSYQAALSRFLSTARDAQGRYTPNAAASVMFILCKDGQLIQMYDVWSSTWTSGGREANTSYWAIEAEGGPPSDPGEPFTSAQRGTLLRLFDEFETLTGRAVVRGSTFREHGELAAELGYDATACPSHRYDWFTGQEDDMELAERVARLERLLGTNGIAKDLAKPDELTAGEEALAYADAQGWSAFLGLGLARQAIAEHEAGVTGPIAEHEHVDGTSGKVKRT